MKICYIEMKNVHGDITLKQYFFIYYNNVGLHASFSKSGPYISYGPFSLPYKYEEIESKDVKDMYLLIQSIFKDLK